MYGFCGFGFRVRDFDGFWDLGGLGVRDFGASDLETLGFRIQGFWGLGFRDCWNTGILGYWGILVFRMWGLGGLGCRILDFLVWVQGFGFRV